MTGTYQTADGVQHSLGSPKNLAIYRKIVTKEIHADITSIVHGCLDADAMCDENPVIDIAEFLGSGGKHECPFCSAIITDKDLVNDLEEIMFSVPIDYDEYNPEEPYMCPICGAMHTTEENARLCCVDSVTYRCPNCNTILRDEDLDDLSVPVDAQQWLVVSKWLGKCLAAIGEQVLLTDEGAYIWAREQKQPEPQNDIKIAAVCAAVGILEGQSNYREVKS